MCRTLASNCRMPAAEVQSYHCLLALDALLQMPSRL